MPIWPEEVRDVNEHERKGNLPKESALAVFFVLEVVAFVAFAVGPAQLSLPMHHVLLPLAMVFTPVTPPVSACTETRGQSIGCLTPESAYLTFSLNVVLDEVALVTIAVGPCEFTEALLDPLLVVAFKFGAVGPALNADAVLCVILPESSVQRTVLVRVETEAMSFVIEPLSLIDVAIFVEKAPEVVGFVILPVALVEAAIGPDLHANALSRVCVF